MKYVIPVFMLMLWIQPLQSQLVLKKIAALPNQYVVSFVSPEDITFSLRKNKTTSNSSVLKTVRNQQQLTLERLKNDMHSTDLKILRNLWIKKSAAISLSSQYLVALKALPYVKQVKADQQYNIKSLGVVTLPQSGELVQDNLQRIDIDEPWSNEYKGQGVVVAILDSGVDPQHVDLAERWRGGSNSWFDPYSQQLKPKDLTGHGTAVASIVLGGNNSGSYIGVAPNALWIAARIFDNNGNSTESAISESLQWILDPDGNPDTDDYPDIVQNSWGLDATEGKCLNPFATELAVIDALGIDQVFAVGNSGLSGSGAGGFSSYLTPAFDSHVISVGALKADDTLLFSSSRGPDICGSAVIPSLVAPGEFIKTADITFDGFDTDNTTINDGSSFSSPHVSGALALLRSQFNSADHMLYRSALYDSAIDLGDTGDDDDYGRGLLQVAKAGTVLQNQSISYRENEVQFSSAIYSFSESELNTRVAVLRSGDITDTASVDIHSVDGTASSGEDYSTLLSTISFDSGESIKYVDIQLLNDSLGENNEAFELQLSQNINVNLGQTSTLKINIKDDDTLEEEDVIGGSSNGLMELFFLTVLWLTRKVYR